MSWEHEFAAVKRLASSADAQAARHPEAEASEAVEAAKRAAITRTIRQGRDAWDQIGNANSFSAWCKIGAALSVGKSYALRTSGANCAWGATYSGAFNKWLAEYGFGAMRPIVVTRSLCCKRSNNGVRAYRISNVVGCVAPSRTSNAGAGKHNKPLRLAAMAS